MMGRMILSTSQSIDNTLRYEIEKNQLEREEEMVEITKEIVHVVLDSQFLDRTVQIRATLPQDIKTQVIDLLEKYKQVFVWIP